MQRQPDNRRDHRSKRARGLRGLLQAGLVVMAMTLPAMAATTCMDEVNRLEAELGVSTALPQAQLREGRPILPSKPETLAPETLNDTLSDTLAESGGVIKPPETGGAMVVEPPRAGDSMPTMPDVKSPGAPPGSLAERATGDARIRSLLTAARTEAQRGDTGQCMERLREAQTLVGAAGK